MTERERREVCHMPRAHGRREQHRAMAPMRACLACRVQHAVVDGIRQPLMPALPHPAASMGTSLASGAPIAGG
eukprot:4496388-Lingulodinium_polyedra.AAC.1